MNSVFIEGLEVHCVVGLLPFEREREQEIRIDAEMSVDFSAEAEADELGSSPDYAESCDLLAAHARSAKRRTLEALATDCCRILLGRWSAVKEVRVSVRKPAAHPDAKNCGVTCQMAR